MEGGIKFCLRWAREDQQGVTDIERTRRILTGTMETIEEYLEFTTETQEDFNDWWLPTQDFAVRISEDNQILFKFWENTTNSTRVLDKRTAMGENQKVQILTQEFVRRLANTKEDLPREEYQTILNKFCQKMYNSGYKEDQIRRVVIAGIRGWGGKTTRCKEQGMRLRRPARESQESRMRTKLLGKSSWFRKGGESKKKDWYKGGKQRSKKRTSRQNRKEAPQSTPRTVLFVEQTPGGELAARLRKLFQRLEPTVGLYVKVVERTGKKLQSLFPLNLWDGAICGREQDCITCYQGAETIPNCTKQSIVYENVCARCIPGARSREPVDTKDLDPDKPALYVGETSRSIAERSREHWSSYKGGHEDSHINKHQLMEHNAAPPDFVMRVVGSYRSALSRQVMEAVQIRRRGGAGQILNSKAEYNRSHIPRLRVEDQEESKRREEEVEKEEEQRSLELSREQQIWEQDKTTERDTERRELAKLNWKGRKQLKTKRLKKEQGNRRLKKFKYDILGEEWGAALPIDREPCVERKEEEEIGGGNPNYTWGV